MMPAQIIVEIVEEGGEIRLEDGRLKVKGIPARLVPLVREHKAGLLALLDTYAKEERAGIMEYDGELPRAEAERLAGIRPAETQETVERYQHPTQPPSVRPERDMGPQSAPATVSCGSCVRFQAGTTKMGIGVCLATTNGLPPKEQRGYLAAYPMAPRRCPEFLGSAS